MKRTHQGIDDVQRKALAVLQSFRKELTWQEFKTFKGQIYAGDTGGFLKGLDRILERKKREESK